MGIRYVADNPLMYDNGQKVPFISGTGSRINMTAGSASSSSALPSGSVVIRVTALDNIRIAFGTGSATADTSTSSILFYAGVDVIEVPEGATYVAVIRVGSTDVPVQIERLI